LRSLDCPQCLVEAVRQFERVVVRPKMDRRSSPSILISVPDHLPSSMRSPTLRSIGISLPLLSRAPGPTAITSASWASPAPCRNDDPALRLLLGLDAVNQDAIMQRPKLHCFLLVDISLGSMIMLRRSGAVERNLCLAGPRRFATLGLQNCEALQALLTHWRNRAPLWRRPSIAPGQIAQRGDKSELLLQRQRLRQVTAQIRIVFGAEADNINHSQSAGQNLPQRLRPSREAQKWLSKSTPNRSL
jgi:hypothetical protein